MLYKLTNTLDGLIDDVPTTKTPAEGTVLLLGSKALDLNQFPQARGIFRVGVGAENVPWEAAKARGVTVGLPSAATAGIIYRETAAFACHLIFRMAYADVGVLETWTKHPRRELGAQKLLVIGTGNIGQLVADSMSAFMSLATYDIRFNQPDEFPGLLRTADIVSLHVPLTPDTRHMLSARELAMLPDGAAIVNTARGKLVDEQALHAELASGRLRAAFDVFWEEPYRGLLATLPPHRFLMTPHVASTCQGFLSSLADDLRVFYKGIGGNE